MTTDLMINQPRPHDLIPAEILSKVVLTGDLSNLDDLEIMVYVDAYCRSLNLNPLTKPFDIITADDKKVLYARKDCTEQLRKIHKVSVKSLTKEMMGDNIYIVTGVFMLPDGREDIATGAVSLAGKTGEKLANAMMKAETKCKRRGTLSICGLGILDESEVDSLENNRYQKKYQESTEIPSPMTEKFDSLANAQTLEDLQTEYTKAYQNAKGNKKLQTEIIKIKDKRKQELDNPTFDTQTGEIVVETINSEIIDENLKSETI